MLIPLTSAYWPVPFSSLVHAVVTVVPPPAAVMVWLLIGLGRPTELIGHDRHRQRGDASMRPSRVPPRRAPWECGARSARRAVLKAPQTNPRGPAPSRDAGDVPGVPACLRFQLRPVPPASGTPEIEGGSSR